MESICINLEHLQYYRDQWWLIDCYVIMRIPNIVKKRASKQNQFCHKVAKFVNPIIQG